MADVVLDHITVEDLKKTLASVSQAVRGITVILPLSVEAKVKVGQAMDFFDRFASQDWVLGIMIELLDLVKKGKTPDFKSILMKFLMG